ncbi:hypothetical protein ACVNPS_00525 [Candidatus Bipolaricaulota sp. J31]
MAVAFWAAAIGFAAEVQLTCKVNPITALRYQGQVYRGSLRVTVPLQPAVGDPLELVGELELSVLSNVGWVLYVSLAGDGDQAEPADGEVILLIGGKEVVIGARPTAIASGSNGVFPLRFDLRAAVPPEARGSVRGEVVLLFTLTTQVRP